ncbi:hypothetical protein C8A00DRAFT_36313 [Chaetomidium leptoderma]|uniref:Uncharacterized protein n=1 Tax=Chaetomidium leptoderma TaxID=669021 RepID=A0AAN6ZUS3_9PEZI|nr:hypothetical protein C8A00DRAFT_36313 [Chaetomidium leptoderma]
MESKFIPSSPKVGSAKRGFSDELHESPTAKRVKRAKRVKQSKKRRSKSGNDSDGYVEQRDWVSFDNSPAAGTPIAQKQTPIMPTPPFPLKQAHKAHVLKSTEKAKDEPKKKTKNDEVRTKKDAKEGVKHTAGPDSPKAEANTRKTRAEPELKGEPKKPILNGSSTGPAVAGPSKPKADKKKSAQEPRELTPLSDIAPRPDYTFKAYPNPPPVQFPPFKKSKEPKESKTEATDTTPTDNAPNGTAMDIETSLIPMEEALTAPAGTKTLKAINKHLKALEANLVAAYPSDQATADMETLRSDMAALHERLDRDELRASIRHAMLFNALVKVSTNIGSLTDQVQIQQQQQQQQQQDGLNNDGTDGENGTVNGGNTPQVNAAAAAVVAKDKLSKSMQQSRKTLKQCLRIYTEDMDRAESREEVAKYGGLCVQYAGDLFKTLG